MLTVLAGAVLLAPERNLSRLHEGYPPGGPQDAFAAAAANRLVGNRPEAPVLEVSLGLCRILVGGPVTLAVTGAPGQLRVNGAPAPTDRALVLEGRSELRFSFHPHLGFRAYLALAGGIEPAPGRTDTYAPGGLPSRRPWPRMPHDAFFWAPRLGDVRFVAGPEATPAALEVLTGSPWQVDPQSSGMGLRLRGPRLALPAFDILSAPVQDGTLQATRQGLAVLLRERGTLGGYPRVGTVIDCDVDRLAQFRAGQRIHFEEVDLETAQAACERQRGVMEAGL
ncbi:MAG: hypothetical protein ACFB21_06470 [Opitutales bacterium]